MMRSSLFRLQWLPAGLASLFSVAALAQQPLQTPPPSGALPQAPAMQVVLPNTAPNTHASGLTIVDAVQRALDINPNLHLQQHAVDFYKGALTSQAGIFDPLLNVNQTGGRTQAPLTQDAIKNAAFAGIHTRAQVTDAANTSVSLSKLFRNGISVTPSLNLARSNDNLTNQYGSTSSNGGVQVTIPLLRNRGAAQVDAQERAARAEVLAQGYDLAQTASGTVAQVANAYWNYIGALRSLNAYRESEIRGEQLLENVRALIGADMLARVEYQTALANMSTRTANRAAGEQAVVQAAQALANAIGVPADQVLSIAAPTDQLPELRANEQVPVTPDALLSYVRGALYHRGDYLSSLTRVNESNILRIGAKGQLKPQLDFTANAGYAGLQENGRLDKYFGVAFQNTVGPTLTGGIVFSFPFGNHFAKGQFQQADAALKQSEDRLVATGNAIATSVVAAANGLNTSAIQLNAAKQAAESYRISLEGARDRLRSGQSSLLDIVQTEDLYLSAQISEISAQVNFANAIANFRYSTGTFVDPTRPTQTIQPDVFYRADLPAATSTTPLPTPRP